MKKARILVVEDQKIISVEIAERLADMGYQVVGSAKSGNQAIQLATDLVPDLILMDIKLEGSMDGIEAADIIKNLLDCPVIFLTAYADDNTIQRAKITEPYGYIVKPLDERELRSAIEIALYKSKMEKNLKDSEVRYKSIVKTLEGLLYIIDLDYNLVLNNLNPIDFYNQDKIKCYEFIYKLDKPCVHCTMEKLKQGITTRTEFFDKSSNRVFYRISTPVLLSNDVEYYQNYLIDITQRKKNEENVTKMLHEKEILLREIHHRVKNNLQLMLSVIRLQISNSSDNAVKLNLKEIEGRLISMAIVHEDLYASSDMSKILLKPFIDKLISHIENAYREYKNKIKINADIDHILLPVEKAIPIGFIINELVINSLKHAFIGKKTGNILIKIGNINENHVLEVSDNGIGFPENISIDKPKSLGLTILKSLCDQLNSKTEVLNDNGTKFKIIFSN